MPEGTNTQHEHNAHRQLFPEQYSHPMIGQRVRTVGGTVFTVERVVQSRWGQLAPVPGSDGQAFRLADLEVIR